MNRCFTLLHRFLLRRQAVSALALALALVVLADPVLAQSSQRNFPKQALRGYLVMTAPPRVELDGKLEKLAPGVRIRNTQNLVVLPGSLRGRHMVVNYVRELNGLLHEVWILTPRETEEERASAPSGRNYVFESETNSAPASGRP